MFRAADTGDFIEFTLFGALVQYRDHLGQSYEVVEKAYVVNL